MPESVSISIGGAAAIFYDVVLPMGLNVDEIQIKTGPSKATTAPFSLSLHEPARIEARIEAASIAAFLNLKSPGGLKDVTVEIADQRLTVRGSMKVIFEVPASAVCSLKIEDARRLVVVLESVDVMGVGAKTLVQGQIDQINPIVSVDDLPTEWAGGLQLESVDCSDGRVLLTASAVWSQPSA